MKRSASLVLILVLAGGCSLSNRKECAPLSKAGERQLVQAAIERLKARVARLYPPDYTIDASSFVKSCCGLRRNPIGPGFFDRKPWSLGSYKVEIMWIDAKTRGNHDYFEILDSCERVLESGLV